MQNNENNISQGVKKTWNEPEIEVIDIQGGNTPGSPEGEYVSPGKYWDVS